MKRIFSVIAALGVLLSCHSEVPSTSISLDKDNLKLQVGETETLIATVQPAGTTDKVEWISSAVEIATVADGVVTAVSAGSATITAKAGSQTATCEVNVNNPPVYLGFEFKLKDGTVYNLYWATSNLCQNGLCAHPEDYGDYYAWGDIEPYYNTLNPLSWKEGKEDGYNWSNYKWANGDGDKITKYCLESFAEDYWDGEGEADDKSLLDPEDDAAHVILGKNWRMPTSRELSQLINNCSLEWISVNGVNGMKFTGTNGNSIFLPAVGRWDGNEKVEAGASGYYWSSYASVPPSIAQSIYVDPVNRAFQAGFVPSTRRLGYAIRPVTE